jgi:ATP-dependent helicase/nuclease subunit A
MILVRKRSEVVAALVRELRRAGIPVAGVDRMDLTAQVVARDLMALGRFCLMPEDDVALASVLKGPFVDFDDDALYALAHGRERQGLDDGRRARPEALWATLRRRGGESGAWGRARHWLGELLGLADQMAPVEFVSHVLTRPAATQDGFSGRRALIRRLGLEAQDPLDELLNLAFAFEAEHPPSLEGFLSWLGACSAEVKREPEGAGDVVRIMTVHGAKGLQAPVVFLIDDIGSPPGQSVTLLWDDARELALWSGGAEGREALARQLHEARRKRQEQEERRLLYVALTRASDRLYIATSRKSEDKEGAGWTSLIAAGMEGLAEPFPFAATGETWSGEGLRLRTVQTRPVEASPGDSATAERGVRLPDAFRQAMAAERPGDRPLSPSRLQGEAPPPPSPLVGDDGAGLRRGRIVHRLLELLPGIAAAQRREAARRLIGRHAPDWPREQAETLADALLALLDAAEHAALFAPGSAAEVSIVGKLGDTVIAGQVDRLVVTPEAVLIVDYKTGAMPQGGAGATPEAYLRQLAAYRAVLREVYPGRAVRCALLWVDRPEFVPIPDNLLGRYEPL